MKFLFLFALTICVAACTSDTPVVVDEAGMTPEQQAEQQAYVDAMDTPPK